MATWPATLPPLTEVLSYAEVLGEGALRTPMDEGSDKVRALPNPEPDVIQEQQSLTLAQTLLLDTFYLTTLSNGTQSFDTTHPRIGTSVKLRFRRRPSPTYLSGIYWTTNLELEVLP